MRKNKTNYKIIARIMQHRYHTYKQVCEITGLSLSAIYSVANGFTRNPRPETRQVLDKYIADYSE